MIPGKHDLITVKQAAKGQWKRILSNLGNIPDDYLDGRGHPCVICRDGTDRFNAAKDVDEIGSCFCRICGLGGDGLSVLQKVNQQDLQTTVNEVGRFLMVNALSVEQPERPKPNTKSSRSGSYSEAVRAVRDSIRSKLPVGITIPENPTTYHYHGRDGTAVGVVLRWDRSDGSKEIRPLSQSSDGWTSKAMPEPRPLYRLSEIVGAETVYVCEGEKAADAIRSFGLVATTSAGGASSPGKSDWSPLNRKRVVIVPDNDKPGERYAENVASLIQQQAPEATTKIARIKTSWPDIPDKGDAADWSEHFDAQRVEYFQDELQRIAEDIDPEAVSDAASPLILTPASDVSEELLTWLWKDRFLIGHINIIAGDPGLGKSLVAIDFAARVSSGADWPDDSNCDVGKVIYATTEDGFADTVKPRLSAAGANHDNIFFLTGFRHSDDSEGPVFLDEHLQFFDQQLSAMTGVKLLILDTLQSFVGESVNTNNNSSSRRVMTPLKRLAEKHRIAILCIEHLNKSATQRGDNATYRIQGSIAFTGAARSVWIVCKDSDDPGRRLLQATKTNLAPDNNGLGLSFRVTGPTGMPHVEWGETNISIPIGELLSGETGGSRSETATEFQRACDWLCTFVTEPVLQSECQAGWKAEMFSDATVRRAKKHLGIQSVQRDRKWYWTPSEAMLAGQHSDGLSAEHLSDLFPV